MTLDAALPPERREDQRLAVEIPTEQYAGETPRADRWTDPEAVVRSLAVVAIELTGADVPEALHLARAAEGRESKRLSDGQARRLIVNLVAMVVSPSERIDRVERGHDATASPAGKRSSIEQPK